MKTRPTGIIRTLPYYGAGEPNEADAMRKANEKLPDFKQEVEMKRGRGRPRVNH